MAVHLQRNSKTIQTLCKICMRISESSNLQTSFDFISFKTLPLVNMGLEFYPIHLSKPIPGIIELVLWIIWWAGSPMDLR
jgi:hypothetical protein